MKNLSIRFTIGLLLGAVAMVILKQTSLLVLVHILPGTIAQLVFGGMMALMGFLYIARGNIPAWLKKAPSIIAKLCWLSGFALGIGLTGYVLVNLQFCLDMTGLAIYFGVLCFILHRQFSKPLDSIIVAIALVLAGSINLALPFAMRAP